MIVVDGHGGQARVGHYDEAMLPKVPVSPVGEARSPSPVRPPVICNDWTALEADSNRLAAQEMIRQEIHKGSIRVRPVPGDPTRVRIIQLSSLDAD